ncbi:MAG: metallophosphoesterase family protein [Proteobacteria bacterium]|nr:metallophosphoesterase family protein [Pseudomonadota bacterium]
MMRWLSRWYVRLGLWLTGIGLFGVLWPALEITRFIIEPENRWKVFLQLGVLHGSWLLFPLIAEAALILRDRARRRHWRRATGAALVLLLAVVAVWARFVEPRMLVVRTTVVPAPIDLDIALVSDIHIGAYTRSDKLQQLVEKLNAMHVDLVVFAGDLTYDPPRDLARALAPLRQLDQPMYAVLGNHDVQLPGPPVQGDIRAVLAGAPVIFIEHRVVDFPKFRLAGLYDYWTALDDTRFLRALPHDKPLLVLMHQPHSLRELRGVDFTLAMAGHTHGGQVALPWLTAAVFKAERDEIYIDGLYDTPLGPLFVTRGVGVTGMPMRLFCPPTIDRIELRRHVR